MPADGSVPGLSGWKWIATPGHSPGHVSFWRSSDRTLISGDAFITTAQESAYAVAMQKPELHGPPKYYTMDWEKSAASVRQLAVLQPEVVVSGHGPAMRGRAMRAALHELARLRDGGGARARAVRRPPGEGQRGRRDVRAAEVNRSSELRGLRLRGSDDPPP